METIKKQITPLFDEHELLQKIAHGDQQAFTRLFEYYQRYVYNYGRKLTRSDEQALEIVQDVFLKLWLNRSQLEKVDYFGPYLTRIVRNHSLNVLRQLAQVEKSNTILQTTSSERDESTTRQLDYNETKRILDEALESLPKQQRIVYKLCHVEGLKYEAVAAQLNISPRTVQAHMSEALKTIRKHFRDNSGAYPMLIAVLFKISG